MHIAFLPQHWLHENASVLSYTYSTLPGLLINSEINTRRMILKKIRKFCLENSKRKCHLGHTCAVGGEGLCRLDEWRKFSFLDVRYEVNTPYVETVRRIFMKFIIDILHKKLWSKNEFCENRHGGSQFNVNEFVAAVYILAARFEWNLE